MAYEVHVVGLRSVSDVSGGSEDGAVLTVGSDPVVREFVVSGEGVNMVVNIKTPEVANVYADRYDF